MAFVFRVTAPDAVSDCEDPGAVSNTFLCTFALSDTQGSCQQAHL